VIALGVLEPSSLPVQLEGLGHLDAGALVVRPSGKQPRVLHRRDEQLVEEDLDGEAQGRSGRHGVGIGDRFTAAGPRTSHERSGPGAGLGDPDGTGVGEEPPRRPVGHDGRRRRLLDAQLLDKLWLVAPVPSALVPNLHSGHGT